MKRKTFLILPVIIFFAIFAKAQVNDTLLFGLDNVKSLTTRSFYKQGVDVYYETNIKAKIKPNLILRNESQYGLTIRPIYDGIPSLGFPLLSYLSASFYDMLTVDLDLSRTILQIGEYDFDNDSISEIVISYGIKGKAIACSIFQYYEPAHSKHALREANWVKIGEFKYGYSDEKYLNIIKDGKIYFPVGSQGYSEAFIYVEGKFVKFQ